jgi:hypothetical protein
MGLQPIPVFHTGTDFKHLDRLMKRYPYIALGGMVKAERKATLRWAATCHKRAEDYGSVFHGFGQTSMENIMSIPWYSVDSSSWASGFMYGRIDLWDGRQWKQCIVGDRKSVMKLAPLIRDHGVDPLIFADRSKYHRSYAVKVAAITWHRFEKFLRQRHGGIRIPEREDGLHLYHANTRPDDLALESEGIHVYLAAGNGSNNNEVEMVEALTGDMSVGRGHPSRSAGTHLYKATSSTTEMVQGTEGLHLYLAQASTTDIMTESHSIHQEVTENNGKAQR